jgi:hypothetical protein
MFVQALFALNLEYYFGDKGNMGAIGGFSRQPELFSDRLQETLALRMASSGELKSATRQVYVLWKEVAGLTGGRYLAKYELAR